MAKNAYHAFPVLDKTERCPICGKPLVTSKLKVTLYDSLNRTTFDALCKLPFCGDCQIPYLNNEVKTNIESSFDGFHLETIPLNKHVSKAYLTRLSRQPALPIQNLPKNNFLFFGETQHHICGTENLTPKQYILHGDADQIIPAHICKTCGRILVSPTLEKKLMKQYPEYLYLYDDVSWDDVFPDKKMIYLLNINQYDKNLCPKCHTRLQEIEPYLKNDKTPKFMKKRLKECPHCRQTYGRESSFKDKPYSLYKFSHHYYQDETFRQDGKHIVLKAGDFLTRHNIQSCISKSHSMEDITARIRIADPTGKELEYDIPAVRCDTCGKLYLLESEYQKIRSLGVPLCSIVENEYWRKGTQNDHAWSESDAKGSIMYIHGYNVNAQEGLTPSQRHKILESLIQDDVLTKAAICSHLDILIQRSSNQPILANARQKWIQDRNYIEHYDSETETVCVNSITRKVYKTKDGVS